MTSLAFAPDQAFERINRHRAFAELLIYNRNWLPSWLLAPALNSFCDHGERFLRGEAQPPLLVRLWWAYKHWQFKRKPKDSGWTPPAINSMQMSQRTGEIIKPNAMIPLAPGQKVDYVPICEGEMVEVIDFHSKTRRSVMITPEMKRDFARGDWFRIDHCEIANGKILYSDDEGDTLEIDKSHLIDRPTSGNVTKRKQNGVNVHNFGGIPIAPNEAFTDPSFSWEDRASIADLPRPDCPKCGTSHPELGTPLNTKKDGWGDSYFTCTDHNCRHTWKLKKVYPALAEQKEGGPLVKGTNIPAVLKWFGQSGLTVEQANEAFKRLAGVAGIDNIRRDSQKDIAASIGQALTVEKMTPDQRLAFVKMQTLQSRRQPLVRITGVS